MAYVDGMTIPSGTITNLTNALSTYLYEPVLKTAFQVQMIQIMVVLAALVIMYRLLCVVWAKFHSPASGFMGMDYKARLISQNEHDWKMLHDRSYYQKNK